MKGRFWRWPFLFFIPYSALYCLDKNIGYWALVLFLFRINYVHLPLLYDLVMLNLHTCNSQQNHYVSMDMMYQFKEHSVFYIIEYWDMSIFFLKLLTVYSCLIYIITFSLYKMSTKFNCLTRVLSSTCSVSQNI